MASYYMNKNSQSNGDNEVHKQGCSWMPKPENRLYLGDFTSCHGAVAKAKTIDSDADGCKHCSPACHTS
jgi:hypothetical protein